MFQKMAQDHANEQQQVHCTGQSYKADRMGKTYAMADGHTNLHGPKVKKRKVLLTSMQYAPDLTTPAALPPVQATAQNAHDLQDAQKPVHVSAGDNNRADLPQSELLRKTAASGPSQDDQCKQAGLAGVFDGFF